MPLADRYTLTVNAEQARVIQESLELLARIHMGQFDHVADTVCPDWDGHPYPDHYRELEDKLRQAIFSQKCERCDGTGKWPGDPEQPCGFCEAGYAPLLNPNAFYGICSPERPDEARVAWDLYSLVRHRLAWYRLPDRKKPPGLPLVMYDEPTTLSKQPRAKIEAENTDSKPLNFARPPKTRAELRDRMSELLDHIDAWAASMGMTPEDWILRQLETLGQKEDRTDAPGPA